MDRKAALYLALFLGIFTGCGDEIGPAQPYLSLTEDTGEALDNVPAVPRLRLSGLPPIPLEDIWLVQGDVSSVSQGRLRRRDPPKTVHDHREPLASWTEGADIVLAPSEVLMPGQRYSLVALGAGLLGSFVVSEESRPLLYLWSAPVARPSEQLAYCAGLPPIARLAPIFGEASLAGREGDGLAPHDLMSDGTDLGVVSNVGTDACVRFTVADAVGEFFVPPSSLGDFLIDPKPVQLSHLGASDRFESMPSACAEALIQFTGGCAHVDGPALRLSVAAGAYFLELRSQVEEASSDQQNSERLTSNRILVTSDTEATHYFGPLFPETEYSLTVVRFSGNPLLDSEINPRGPAVSGSTEHGLGGGSPKSDSVVFTSGPAAARFVLTEMLADPLGPEPASEWVEIFNAGNAAGSLKGLLLWDSSGASELPDSVLQAGEFGLIVRHDFSVGVDAIPHPDCIPLFVDSIGQNGLRNSGEEVRLETFSGELLSRIPAIAARSGQSVARRDPWSPDLESSFLKMSPPSPGSFGLEGAE